MDILSNFSINQKIFIIYLIIINLIALITFLIDKIRARNNDWRISEGVLLGNLHRFLLFCPFF